ncbi:hypothetical protein ACTA71_005021 [Dictyostelium dimigraforme]
MNCFIIISLLFLFYQNVNSQIDPNTLEYTCSINLANQLGILSFIPINNTDLNNQFYDFCNSTTASGLYYKCRNGLITYIYVRQNSTTELKSNDFSCLSNKLATGQLSFSMVNPIISNDFFLSFLPSTNFYVEITSKRVEGVKISNFSKNILSIYYTLDYQPTTVIKFSMIKYLNSLYITGGFLLERTHDIYYENDITNERLYMSAFRPLTKNIPDFTNFNTRLLDIVLLPNYNQSSLSNIKTISQIHSWNYNPPSKIIDLSQISSKLNRFYISKVTKNFTLFDQNNNNIMPIILPNNTFETVYLRDGLISYLNLTQYNTAYLDLTSNELIGDLPILEDSSILRKLVLNKNKLTGTIPNSYCGLQELEVSNNVLVGEIPSCFTCFFPFASTLKNKFSNNGFTNFNTQGPCTSIIPNIVISSVDKSSHTLFIFGKDLGPSGSYFNNTLAPGYVCNGFSLIKPNSLFRCVVYTTIAPPRIIKLEYINSGTSIYSFTLSPNPLPPQIESVDWVKSDMEYITINGSFFTYNTSNIKIEIIDDNGEKQLCNVVGGSTFFQIKCQLPLDSFSQKSKLLSFVTIDKLTTQITLNQNSNNTIINCTNYNNCNGNGICNTQFGECQCYSGYQGVSCNLPLIKCPNDCSGNGNCNNVTGVCQCNSYYQGNSCDLPILECPNNCSGNGICDTLIGICLCNLYYQGSSCNLPILQCPNDCSGNGICNTLTGVCQCNSDYQGNSCSLPLLPCPNDCSGNGNCNNVTGICRCNSNSQGNSCNLPLVPCPNDCNANGNCNNRTGICKCNTNYQGNSCDLPLVQCPENCSGNGICNNITGDCQCTPNYQGISCNLHIPIPCPNNCSGNGQCDSRTGICQCITQPHEWIGNDCSIPLHFVSSVSPSYTKGGNASFYGWFSNVNSDLNILIGSNNCSPIYIINENLIICNAPRGSGEHSIQIDQNSIQYTLNKAYKYQTEIKSCPNNCISVNNGKCNSENGFCECNNNWFGYDCGFLKGTNNRTDLPESISSINLQTGDISFLNQQTNFEILITSLLELDINNNQVAIYQLNKQWTSLKNDSKIYTFTQNIQSGGGCTITYMIEEILNDKIVSFGDIDYKIEKDSLKVTISIENYNYSINRLENKKSTNDECNDDTVEIKNLNQDESLNYLTIKKDGKVLNARFIDRVESDGRSTYMSTEVVSKTGESMVIGMNLPHFIKKCIIDPDFSVLLSQDFVKSCDDNTNKNWIIPVAVVVPCFAIASILIILFFTFKKMVPCSSTNLIQLKCFPMFNLENYYPFQSES